MTPASFSQHVAGSHRILRVYDGLVVKEGRHGSFDVSYQGAWLLRAGQVDITRGDQLLQEKAGHWVILPPGSRHQNFAAGSRLWSASFLWEHAGGQPILSVPGVVSLPAKQSPKLNQSATMLSRCVCRRYGNPSSYLPVQSADHADYLEIEAAFIRWLRELLLAVRKSGVNLRSAGEADERAIRARKLLDVAPLTMPPSYDALAQEVGVSRSQLQRLFKMEFHLTLHEYFDRRRAESVRRMLLEPHQRIKAVAAELGFTELPHFSQWFQRHEGRSPRQYRQLAGLSS